MTATEMNSQPAPAPIAPPPDFPVAWEQPDDERAFWTLDAMHFPDPMHPLEYTLMEHTVLHGMRTAFDAYALPLRVAASRINTYYYQSMMPLMLPPEQMEAMGKRSEERTGTAVAHLSERWEAEQLPEIQQHLAYWRAFDCAGATLPELLEHLDQTITRLRRAWQIHFEVATPMALAMSMFSDLYQDLFGDQGAFAAYRLLQGFDNKSLEAGRALWRLSRTARAVPFVREVLTWSAEFEVVPLLERRAAGRAFLQELRAYLDEYGRRGDKWAIIGAPSWVEDPTPVITTLKEYMAQPDRDELAEMNGLAAEREQALAAARTQLQGYPQPVVAQFEMLLKSAQAGTVLQEDHNFWIDQRCMHEVRRVMLEFGRRFAAADAIAAADDIGYLTLEELRATAAKLPGSDMRALVAERKAEMEHFRAVAPPPALGTLPPGPPPDSPITRVGARFWGAPPPAPTEPGVLRGNPGSPGRVRGVAKVLRSLADAPRLQPGDILVAQTTAPPWTPLFATAAAVVTDTGGILSHCAIVAREYRIPAVVGTAVGTAQIRDGHVLEVDGDAGTVRIVDEL